MKGLHMPRKSPFHIDLSIEEERELLRRPMKYTLPYFEVQRAKMILMAAIRDGALWIVQNKTG